MSVTIRVFTPDSSLGQTVPVRVGVPWPRATMRESNGTQMMTHSGETIAHQGQVLERWSDGSAKWMLIDALIPVAGSEAEVIISVCDVRDGPLRSSVSGIDVTCPNSSNSLKVSSCSDTNAEICGITASLLDEKGREWRATLPAAEVVSDGPTCTRLVADAIFERDGKRFPLDVEFSIEVFHSISLIVMEVDVLNPQASLHPGNVWDLGDPGSVRFSDLSVNVTLPDGIDSSECIFQELDESPLAPGKCWTIYQDSSGGENWDSQNHVDHNGQLTVSFRGFRLLDDQSGDVLQKGDRAQPLVAVSSPANTIAISVEDFWQNFPSAIRVRSDRIELGLFAGESRAGFELQGGERKRQRLQLAVAEDSRTAAQIISAAAKVAAWVDSEWIEKTGVIPWFKSAATLSSGSEYEAYIETIVSGPLSFDKRREVIDEYGWRNFGDQYADHEAVHENTPGSVISHYNNQYDFLYGAALHALRKESAKWWQLMRAAARHHIDIDVYHTSSDRAAYNHGLFWHTEHYRSAGTATHRTYSQINKSGRDYGGGPSNEHNYTSGLTLYYFLSGDTSARDVVIGLADWVINMDDGTTTIWSIVDPTTPTGLSSRTKSDDYHGPGRGAGNSINALLDAHSLSSDRRYLEVAEQFIRRCIHPNDKIDEMQLDKPEERWSYVVFLQIIGRYLWTKEDLGEYDFHYHYARDSLLQYAEWMMDNEKPYSEQFDKVDLPTETWPAQDIRKAHVLYIASTYAAADRQSALHQKAEYFFEHCLTNLLKFDTAYLCRPRVLLTVYGHVRDFFNSRNPDTRTIFRACAPQKYSYGEPRSFVPQRANLMAALRHRTTTVGKELARKSPTALRLAIRRLRSVFSKSDSGGR